MVGRVEKQPIQFTKEFPVKFTGDFFYKYVTLRQIFKKSYQEGVFDFFIRPPNMSKFLNPQEICQDIFLYMYKFIWVECLIYLKMTKIKGHF